MWNNKETCYYRIGNIASCDGCVYAYDFDDTLVRRNSSIALPNVIERLKKMIEDGNHIVVFSNQNGIEKKKTSHENVQGIMDLFSESLDNSISFFYAISDDKYRKPMRGMYDLFRSIVDKEIVYYCGDAAGRKKDFNISDLYFANNIGISFKLPEEVFNDTFDCANDIACTNKKSLKNDLYGLDIWKDGILDNPRKIVNICSIPSELKNELEMDSDKKKLVIMVGPQGSGKSTLSSMMRDEYNLEVMNNDTTGSFKKSMKKFMKVYNEPSNKGIIIDNTNPSKFIREEWIKQVSDVAIGNSLRIRKNPYELKFLWKGNIESEGLTLPVIPFYGHYSSSYGCFSNFYNSPFDFTLPKCCSDKKLTLRVQFGEQAIMACKAAVMNDWESYEKISRCNTNPRDCKMLGRKVKPFVQERWSNVILEVAIEVVTQKFAQNPVLWNVLNKTGNNVIAEMTRNDRIWGTGIDKSHVDCNTPSAWIGTNILGYALMVARDRLRGKMALPTSVPVYKSSNWKVIVVFIDVSKKVSLHSVRYRMNNGHQKIPSVAIHMYYKKLEKPTDDEGKVIRLEGIVHNDCEYNHNLRFV